MAHVVAFVPDLLFGSNVLGMLHAAGHDAALCADDDALWEALARRTPDVLLVDLTAEVPGRVEVLGRLRAAGKLDTVRTIAFYSHVDVDTRIIAEEAGFDVIVPRSRMAREGAALIERVLA